MRKEKEEQSAVKEPLDEERVKQSKEYRELEKEI
jgi:hypothetical protein